MVVASVQRLGHFAPCPHPFGIIGMGFEPRFDIAAPFRRQFVVDESVQFVFGDGNPGVGHGCRLFSVEMIPAAIRSSRRKCDRVCNSVSPKKSATTRSFIKFVIYFTRRNAGRSPSSTAFTWARARARRDITVPIGTPWMSATSR